MDAMSLQGSLIHPHVERYSSPSASALDYTQAQKWPGPCEAFQAGCVSQHGCTAIFKMDVRILLLLMYYYYYATAELQRYLLIIVVLLLLGV